MNGERGPSHAEEARRSPAETNEAAINAGVDAFNAGADWLSRKLGVVYPGEEAAAARAEAGAVINDPPINQPSGAPPPPGAERNQEELDAREEESIRQVERSTGELENGWERRLERFKDDPETLVHFMPLIHGRQFQQLKIEQKHGRQLNGFQQVMEGDLMYELDENGQVRYNAWNEFVQRGGRVIDKQTLVSAGLLGVVGLCTGGVGLPAMGMVAGRSAGKASVELWNYLFGKERKLHSAIAKRMAEDWKRLQGIAREIQDSPDLSPEDEAKKMEALINGFYHNSSAMNWDEGNLRIEERKRETQRDVGGKWGAVIGGAGGLVAGFTGMATMIHHATFGGEQGATGAIKMVDNVWNFSQTAAEGTWQVLQGGQAAALGVLGNIGAGIAAAYGGFKLGNLWDHLSHRGEAKGKFKYDTEHEATRNGLIKETKDTPPAVEPVPQAPIPSTPEGGDGGGGAESRPAIPEQPQELVDLYKKPALAPERPSAHRTPETISGSTGGGSGQEITEEINAELGNIDVVNRMNEIRAQIKKEKGWFNYLKRRLLEQKFEKEASQLLRAFIEGRVVVNVDGEFDPRVRDAFQYLIRLDPSKFRIMQNRGVFSVKVNWNLV